MYCTTAFRVIYILPMLRYILTCRIPNVTVNMDDGEVELEISDNPFDCSRLDVKNIPLIVTLNKVGILANGVV